MSKDWDLVDDDPWTASQSARGESRAGRLERGKRRRRRRLVRGLTRLVTWMLLLGAAFIFGLGYGRVASESGRPANAKVTVAGNRGTIMATLPVRTVVQTVTRTTVRTVTAKTRKKPKKPKTTARAGQ